VLCGIQIGACGPLRRPFGDSRLRPVVDYGFEYRIEGKKALHTLGRIRCLLPMSAVQSSTRLQGFSGAQSWQEQKPSCAVVHSVIRCRGDRGASDGQVLPLSSRDSKTLRVRN